MKQFVKPLSRSMLWSLILVFGGLFMASESMAQQPSHSLVQGQPQINWKSSAQALQIAESEISLLTLQLNQLIQLGEGPIGLTKKKDELQFWMSIRDALMSGSTTKDAAENAIAMFGGVGTDAQKELFSYFGEAELEAIINGAISKLSN